MSLEPLLALQQLDTTIAQTRHRLAALPVRQRITQDEAVLASLSVERAPLLSRRDDLARSQKRVEDEISGVEVKVTHEEARLYSGTVTSPRELQAIQEEIDSLRRRQGDLETEVLEIMDLTEPVDTSLMALDTHEDEVEARLVTLRAELVAQAAELEAELTAVEGEREAAASELDAGLVATYDKLRVDLGGTAVARLAGSVCGACHLGLSAVDAERIRKGQVPTPTCPECGALLVV